jgi:hypothetical protein
VDIEDQGGDLVFCRLGSSSTRLALARLADDGRAIASLAFDLEELAGLEALIESVAARLDVLRRVGDPDSLPPTLFDCGRIAGPRGLGLEARIRWPGHVELLRTDREGRALASLMLTLREAGQLPSIAGDALQALPKPQGARVADRELLCRTRAL